MRTFTAVTFATLVLAMSTTAGAQSASDPVIETVKLSGPRFGFTFLSDGVVRKLKQDVDKDFKNVGPMVSQFGWQFEKRFVGTTGGFTPVTEWVVLLGGLEQSIAIPSLTWLVGLRAQNGAEFGIGPNVGPAGAALAITGGVTFRSGNLNVPVNLAVVPSKDGVRVSLLAGFNMRRR